MTTTTYQRKVDAFLESKTIAVAGYSLSKQNTGNIIFDKLKKQGYSMVAINPGAKNAIKPEVFPNLSAVPGPVDAVLIATAPSAAVSVVRECIALGIKKVWMHRSVDNGSYSPEAEQLALENGIEVINIGCPMMFVNPDLFHRCFRWVMKVQGKFKEV